jgi:hypothetical protein
MHQVPLFCLDYSRLYGFISRFVERHCLRMQQLSAYLSPGMYTDVEALDEVRQLRLQLISVLGKSETRHKTSCIRESTIFAALSCIPQASQFFLISSHLMSTICSNM